MLANLARGLARPAGRGLARHTQGGLYACSGENTAPGVSVIPLPEGGGVVHNLSKIAARFVDLFIQLNGV